MRINGAIIAISQLTLLLAGSLAARTPLWNEPEAPAVLPETVAEREAIEAARKNGFADFEIDSLHTKIAQLLKRFEIEAREEGVGSFREMTENTRTRKIIHAKDSDGKEYFRIRMRYGFSLSTSIYPELFTYRVDCFFYPRAGGEELERVVFQFYRINHHGIHTSREIRRLSHPAPGHLKTEAAQPPAGTPAAPESAFADNGKIVIDYYERSSNITAVWEEGDGSPMAVLPIKSDRNFILNDPAAPIPFGRQVSLIRRYRLLLRTAAMILENRYRSQELEKALILEKTLEF